MPRNVIVFVVVFVSFLALLFGVSAHKHGQSADASASSVDTPAETGDADLELLAGKSLCLANPYDARLNVYVTIRNNGPTEETMRIRPWRRYSDASVNDSFMDAFEVAVPAYSTKKTYGSYGYNAEAHTLLECGVFVDDATEPTPLKSL